MEDFPTKDSAMELSIFLGLQTSRLDYSFFTTLFLADFLVLASVLVNEVVLTPP